MVEQCRCHIMCVVTEVELGSVVDMISDVIIPIIHCLVTLIL